MPFETVAVNNLTQEERQTVAELYGYPATALPDFDEVMAQMNIVSLFLPDELAERRMPLRDLAQDRTRFGIIVVSDAIMLALYAPGLRYQSLQRSLRPVLDLFEMPPVSERFAVLPLFSDLFFSLVQRFYDALPVPFKMTSGFQLPADLRQLMKDKASLATMKSQLSAHYR